MTKNIAYATPEIARYFATNRVQWSQFYESEREIICQMNLGPAHDVLDIGCGCGGLGLALEERFGVTRYTGVEINTSAAGAGRQMNPRARIIDGDILDVSRGELRDRTFDVVFSLSCVDWNNAFRDMLASAWTHVRPGGYLMATFRLTDGEGCADFARSHQFINYEGKKQGELAAYVVLNADELMRDLNVFAPSEINAYGYWGPPSATAVTPYDRLCFAAFSICKAEGNPGLPRLDLRLPPDLLGK